MVFERSGKLIWTIRAMDGKVLPDHAMGQTGANLGNVDTYVSTKQ